MEHILYMITEKNFVEKLEYLVRYFQPNIELV